ncbi:hypothetical protein AGDE_14472 [Angomonas deanei]|nr:hypothetical protein AGDE_14472 [Angomonas deanei]|eukprot:EPY20797.1 hypothetical protein AGDE_14472 [Angomonas deanei]
MTIRIEDKHLKEEVEAFVKKHFPSATLNEFKGQRFVYALPQDTKLSDTFWTLQENKEAVGITDYSVSQTSIEQVFLKISEEQARRAEEKGKEDILYTRSHATKRKAKGNTTAVRGNRGKRGVLIIDEEEEEDAAAYPSTGGKSGKQHPNPLAMSREEEEVIYGGGGYPDEDYVQPFY